MDRTPFPCFGPDAPHIGRDLPQLAKLAKLSNHSFLKLPQALQASILAIHRTNQKSQPSSTPTTGFSLSESRNTVWVKQVAKWVLEPTLKGSYSAFLRSYCFEGGCHYTLCHAHIKIGSHGCRQLDCLQITDPLK